MSRLSRNCFEFTPPVKSYTSRVAIGLVSFTNAFFYYPLAVAGGMNIQRLFGYDTESLNIAIYAISIWACICYGLFMYRTLEYFDYGKNPGALGLLTMLILGPTASLAFFGGGYEGCQLVPFLNNTDAKLTFSIVLLLLRHINMVDGIYKFPVRYKELKDEVALALQARDYAQLARSLMTTIASVGYALSTTDAIYFSLRIMMGMNGEEINPIASGFFYLISVIGAIGVFPLALYWTQKGIRQLTNGGKNKTIDPTDCYTYLGLLLTIPVFLGILGSATVAQGDVLGRSGLFGMIVRVVSSLIYAACAGTVPWSKLLRNLNCLNKLSCSRAQSRVGAAPAVSIEFSRVKPVALDGDNSPVATGGAAVALKTDKHPGVGALGRHEGSAPDLSLLGHEYRLGQASPPAGSTEDSPEGQQAVATPSSIVELVPFRAGTQRQISGFTPAQLPGAAL